MIIYYAFFNLIFAYTVVLYMDSFISFRDGTVYKKSLFGVLFWSTSFALSVLAKDNAVLKAAVGVIVVILLVKGIYKADFVRALFAGAGFYMIAFITYAFILGLLLSTGKFDMKTLTDSEVAFFKEALNILVVFLAVAFINRFADREKYMRGIRESVNAAAVPLITIVAICFMIFGYNESISGKTVVLLKVITMAMLGFNVLTFYLLADIRKEKTKSFEIQKRLEENRENIETYRKLKDNYELQKKSSHDRAEQLQVLSSLAEKGEYDLLKQCLKDYAADSNVVCRVSTGNLIVDSILENKLNEATARGILMSMSFNDLTDITVEDKDLITILSNLLTNAIEGCERAGTGKKIIKVNVSQREQLTVSVINTCGNEIVIGENGPVTTKQDAENHGIGTGLIEETVKKYNGVVKYSFRNGEFGAVIVI